MADEPNNNDTLHQYVKGLTGKMKEIVLASNTVARVKTQRGTFTLGRHKKTGALWLYIFSKPGNRLNMVELSELAEDEFGAVARFFEEIIPFVKEECKKRDDKERDNMEETGHAHPRLYRQVPDRIWMPGNRD